MAVRLIRYGVVDKDDTVISHNLLVDRELSNQHPIYAISGLQLALDAKYEKPALGIPISDLGFNPATQEGLVALEDNVDNKMIILNSDVDSISIHVDAIQDFLNNIYNGTSSGVPGTPTINFAYRNGFREDFISAAGDTDFYLVNTFMADGKTLRVYRDGELMTINVDYTEASNNKIVFTEPMDDGQYVSFICETTSIVYSPIHEEILSIANQTDFILKNTYMPGANTLSIYVKGHRLECGTDYQEIDANTVKLLITPYDAGTKFIFRQEGVQSAGQVLYHENDYQQKSWKLNYKATAGQKVITLSETFIPGTHMISVYADGLLQWEGGDFDYIEIDEKTIQFNYELDLDEGITVICNSPVYNWTERFINLEGQARFELHNVYYVGRDDIVVYENGLQLMCGDDYTEISNRAIELTEAPPAGSRITVFKRR